MFLSLALLAFFSAEASEHHVADGAVRIAGVGPENPIVYDNDWWADVFDNGYLWAQASLGKADLRGNVVTRDMWQHPDYLYPMERCTDEAAEAVRLAESSGMSRIPQPVAGATLALRRPESGRVEDTAFQETDGSRLIVAEARKATPDKPLLVIVGGPLTTVANALLADPEIGDRMVVFTLTVDRNGYNGKDGWSVFVVASRTRVVDWGTGAFWKPSSVLRPGDFAGLPDNPFTADMKRLIASDLGLANQLGDGAPLVWLWQPKCWTAAEVRQCVWADGQPQFRTFSGRPTAPTLLTIPREATDLPACRREFFRVVGDPKTYESPERE